MADDEHVFSFLQQRIHTLLKESACPGEQIVCVISIGYGETQGKEHNSRPVTKVCSENLEEMPEWFLDGLDAAMKAPTAINQQKFMISMVDGEPLITSKRGPLTKIDLGIVKYNFEAASGHKCK